MRRSARLSVELSACPNPDYDHDPRATVSIAPVRRAVVDLNQARRFCLQFIAEHNLGGGNWTGGTVYDGRTAKVARVAYNGRIFDDATGKEIVLQ